MHAGCAGSIDRARARLASEWEQREAAYDLAAPRLVEDTTWSYGPTRLRQETIAALVNDPGVVDTHGIDRGGATLEEEALWARLERTVPPLRMQLLPGLRTRPNGLAWLYYVLLAVPIASAVVLLLAVRRGDIARPEAAVIGATTLLGFVIFQTLVRGSPDSRLGDVATILCVLAAWAAGRWPPPSR